MAFDTLASLGFVADTRQLKQAGKDLDTLSSKSRSAESSTGTLTRSMGALAASVGSVVSVLAGSQKLIAVTREFDVLNAGLITATGNADNAASAFAAIEDFAKTTPYSLAQATKAFTQLVNLGLTPSEKALKSYGNTASAMGKDLSQMVEAVADATVGEFERLKEFGIKSQAQGDQVTFTFRGVATTVKKSAAEIEGYLMGLGQNEFAGAMENRMKTLDGAISNLSDSWDGLFRTIASNGAGDLIADSVRTATSAIDNLTASVASGQMEAYLDAIAAKFDDWGRDISVVLDAVGQLFSDAGEYWSIDMGETATLIVNAFKNMPENIRAFLQIITVEVSAHVDRMIVFGKMAADALNPFSNGFDPTADFARIGAAREQAIGSIMNERELATQSFEQQTQAADGLRVKYDELTGSVDKTVDRLAQYKVGADEAAKSTAALAKEMDKLDEAALDHFDALEELDQIEKDRIARKEEAIDAMLEPFEGGTKAVKEFQSISEKAAERIESAFADAWMNAFDGFESVVDGMKNAFKRMLAEMAHMALTRPIMVSLGMGGMLPAGANAAGTASSLSSGLGLLGGIGGGLVSAGGMIGGAFGGGLAGAGGLVGAGNIGGLFSGAGSLLGSGNIAAGLGMSMPIIAGAVVAAMGINKLTGGGLFGTSYKTTGQDLGLSFGGGDVSGMITTEESKKKSLFRGTSRRTSTSAYDASALDSAFDQITAALGQAANTFGIEGADAIINGFSSSVKINIKDKTEAEIQQAISDWVGSTTTGLVNAVFGNSLEGLQREGEGVIDTVNRLSANMSVVKSITQSLGLGFELTGKAAMIASTNIVDLAGGIENLAALSSQYYQSFYTDAERQAGLQKLLAESFSELNLVIPASREEFRSYVDALDLTTEAGQQAFAALMQLVPGMNQYLTAVESATEAARNAAQAAEQEAKAKAEALKSQGLDLQLRLYDALGQSSEALALRRQLELESTDESLRAMLLSIYAAQDAASAQQELERAQSQAADAARDAANAMQDMIAAAKSAASDAFGKLQESADREKDRLATELDLKLSAIDAERDALKEQRDSVVAGYQQQGKAVEQYLNKLEGLNEVLTGFLSDTGAQANPFKELAMIYTEAKAGLLPDQARLQSVLSGVSGNGSAGFGSAFEQARAMAVARNQALGIQGAVGGAMGGAKSQLQWIEQQTIAADEFYIEQLAKLDQSAALAQELHDSQVTKIDEQLSEAQKQLNVLLGVDDRLLTIDEALSEFYAAMDSANLLQLDVGMEQVSAINAVEAAVIALHESVTSGDAGYWAGYDTSFAPPTMQQSAQAAQPLTQEMVDLLKELVAGNESIAKHTKTSADALELTQLQSELA
jgi:hypothetical protein